MMTRTVWTGALPAACMAATVGLAGAVVAPGGDALKIARGKGIIMFGEDGHGRGLIRFDMSDDGGTLDGSLLFAGEDHHHFPDIVVELGNLQQAKFTGRTVTFSGPGALHDDPVQVTVRATDKGDNKRVKDLFSIRCMDGATVVYEAHGELIRGDIIVDPGSGRPLDEGVVP